MRQIALTFIRQNKKKNPFHLSIVMILVPILYFAVFTSEKKGLQGDFPAVSAANLTISIGGSIHAPSFPVSQVTPFHPALTEALALSDLNIISLAAPIEPENFQGAKGTAVIPPAIMEILHENSINAVQLSDQHVLNLGPMGLMETLRFFEEREIQTVGAGLNKGEALAPLYFTKSNKTIALLALNPKPLPGWSAALNRVGVAAANADLPKILQEAAGKSDLIIALLSFTAMALPEEQQQMARQLIEQGANIVVGTTPGPLKAVEHYEGGLIFYNIGSLSPSQEMYSYAREAVFLRIVVGPKNTTEVQAIPLLVKPSQVKILGDGLMKTKIAHRLGQCHWSLDLREEVLNQ